MRRSVRAGNNGVVIAAGLLLVVSVFFSLMTHRFLTPINVESVISRSVPLVLVVIGSTFALAAGEIDLSMGAVGALAGVVFMQIANTGQILFAWSVIVLIGVVVGLINSGLINIFRINSFIATLATQFTASGLAFALSNSQPVRGNILNYSMWFTQPFLWRISPRIALALAAIVIAHILLTQTTVGRRFLASGGNARVARLAGIRVGPLITGAFILSGIVAALAGAVVAIGLNSGPPAGGSDILLTAIAAAIIGGSRMAGGEGSIAGSVLAVIALVAVGNGMNLLNVTPYGQTIVGGTILLTAVAIDAIMEFRAHGRLQFGYLNLFGARARADKAAPTGGAGEGGALKAH
jgi:ribose transport system permease protein